MPRCKVCGERSGFGREAEGVGRIPAHRPLPNGGSQGRPCGKDGGEAFLKQALTDYISVPAAGFVHHSALCLLP